MIKQVLFGKESREKTLAGVQKITDAVRVTMGASGKCVLIGNSIYGNDGLLHLPTLVTKDGFTVTKHFELPDAIENRGAMMIKEAAMQTVEQVGDATTCTCVLAESLISNGMKLIDEGANSQQLKKGMDAALEYVVAELKKISTPVKGDLERIRQIATVSANNDTYIGNLIAKAFEKIGDEGIIDIEAAQGTETEIKMSDGYKIGNGWISPFFVTNKDKAVCELYEPLILLYDKRVIHHTQVQKALEISIQEGRPILIICEDAAEEGLAFLVMNTIQQRVKCCVVKSPSFGELRKEEMMDLALLTGGTFVSDIHGKDVKKITKVDLGSAKKVIVSKDETVIIGGNTDQKELEDLLNELRMNLAQAKNEDEKLPIEKRIARLKGGVAVIQVGAATETEMKEKLDRYDDAVRATKAAISEGFVAGGGTAFINLGTFVDGSDISDFQKGERLVHLSLSSPVRQICENAGINGDEVLVKLIERRKIEKKESGDLKWDVGYVKSLNYGYNVLTNKFTDMVEAGIIDSTKALRCALTNAVSVAGMVLTSECSIITTS
jgi:chaperonin GroEL